MGRVGRGNPQREEDDAQVPTTSALSPNEGTAFAALEPTHSTLNLLTATTNPSPRICYVISFYFFLWTAHGPFLPLFLQFRYATPLTHRHESSVVYASICYVLSFRSPFEYTIRPDFFLRSFTPAFRFFIPSLLVLPPSTISLHSGRPQWLSASQPELARARPPLGVRCQDANGFGEECLQR